MATVLQLRRGNHATNLTFVGAEGELTYDTETHDLRVHDSTTPGGSLVGDSFPDQTSQTGKVLKTNGTSVYWDNVDSNILTVLDALYPIGSLYIGTQSSCPLATLLSDSEWEKIEENRCLQTSSSSSSANTKISAGLPNITGSLGNVCVSVNSSGATPSSPTGAFSATPASVAGGNQAGQGRWVGYLDNTQVDASRSNPVYGASSTVQPAAYVVNVWRRTA